MKISLYDLDVELEYDYEEKRTNNTPGGEEVIPARVTLTSVKAKGIEIISLLTEYDLLDIEEKILEEEF